MGKSAIAEPSLSASRSRTASGNPPTSAQDGVATSSTAATASARRSKPTHPYWPLPPSHTPPPHAPPPHTPTPHTPSPPPTSPAAPPTASPTAPPTAPPPHTTPPTTPPDTQPTQPTARAPTQPLSSPLPLPSPLGGGSTAPRRPSGSGSAGAMSRVGGALREQRGGGCVRLGERCASRAACLSCALCAQLTWPSRYRGTTVPKLWAAGRAQCGEDGCSSPQWRSILFTPGY
eukprot:COSAG06_NODE_1100_length_10710_cov_9.583168_6_plen_232_part_00